jgi:hypothetical protein
LECLYGADEEREEVATRADHEWERLKKAMSQAAMVTLACKPRAQKKEWIKADTFALTEQKRNCVWDSDEYRNLQKQVPAKL